MGLIHKLDIMKNIVVALFILVGGSAFSQAVKYKVTLSTYKADAKPGAVESPEVAALKNISELNAFVTLDKPTNNVLLELFTTKANMLANSEGFSQERRDVVAQLITAKMESVIPAAAMAKIRANAALLKKLTY